MSVAPRSSRLSSWSLPRLRSQPIHCCWVSLQTRRRCSSRKRSPAASDSVLPIQPRDAAGRGVHQCLVPVGLFAWLHRPSPTAGRNGARPRATPGKWISSRSSASSMACAGSQQDRARPPGSAAVAVRRRAAPGRAGCVAANAAGDRPIDEGHRGVQRRKQAEEAEQRQGPARRRPDWRAPAAAGPGAGRRSGGSHPYRRPRRGPASSGRAAAHSGAR